MARPPRRIIRSTHLLRMSPILSPHRAESDFGAHRGRSGGAREAIGHAPDPAGAVERMRAARKAQAGLFAANVLPTIPEVQAAGWRQTSTPSPGNSTLGGLWPQGAKTLAPRLFLITSQFCENGLASAPPFLLRPPSQNMRSLPDRYPDLRPVLDGVGKDFLRLAKTIAGIKQAMELVRAILPRPLLDLLEIAIIRAQRIVGLFV